MNLKEHAIFEINYLKIEDKEKEKYIKNFINNFIEEFSKQEHSYYSAKIVISSFKLLMKDKTFIDKKIEEIISNYDKCDLCHQLAKKYHELVNTEEFVFYDIDEEWIKSIIIRLMDWKPITPLQGTPDEWRTHDEEGNKYGPPIQNKRYSAVFADDENGTNAYNVDGKVFIQNGVSFTCKDSHIPITFPYEVPIDREEIILEDYIPVEDTPKFYIKYRYLDQNKTEDLEEIIIGYKKSTLDITINNPKFYKADYCILSKYNSHDNEQWYIRSTYDDMPIYRVRMNARLIQAIKEEIIIRKEIIVGVYLNKECTIEAEL